MNEPLSRAVAGAPPGARITQSAYMTETPDGDLRLSQQLSPQHITLATFTSAGSSPIATDPNLRTIFTTSRDGQQIAIAVSYRDAPRFDGRLREILASALTPAPTAPQ